MLRSFTQTRVFGKSCTDTDNINLNRRSQGRLKPLLRDSAEAESDEDRNTARAETAPSSPHAVATGTAATVAEVLAGVGIALLQSFVRSLSSVAQGRRLRCGKMREVPGPLSRAGSEEGGSEPSAHGLRRS